MVDEVVLGSRELLCCWSSLVVVLATRLDYGYSPYEEPWPPLLLLDCWLDYYYDY